MGLLFMDQYSLLHFATGIIAYFVGLRLDQWILIHVIFEIIENSEYAMKFINKYLLAFWPGGKDYADSLINFMGDNIFAIMGWIVAYIVDYYGSKYKYFTRHLDYVISNPYRLN